MIADMDISFGAALAETRDRRRHLLLGNGFSRAVHSGFDYRHLFDEAVRFDRSIAPLFDNSGFDFEKAMGSASQVDQVRIREAFIGAIARVHPRPGYLTPDQRYACGQFLELFAGLKRGDHRGRVFTTNYDLLLYWVLMQRQAALKMYDGFDSDCVWKPERDFTTLVTYLHGAVHQFEEPYGTDRSKMKQWKLRWRDDASLIEQVRFEVRKGRLPVFVSEGSSSEKRHRIGRNQYLRTGLKAFSKACSNRADVLFTVGHSLSSVDDHIIDQIGSGNAAVYIGVFNDADDARAREVVNMWQSRRDAAQSAMHVRIFRTVECSIWNYGDSAPIGSEELRDA